MSQDTPTPDVVGVYDWATRTQNQSAIPTLVSAGLRLRLAHARARGNVIQGLFEDGRGLAYAQAQAVLTKTEIDRAVAAARTRARGEVGRVLMDLARRTARHRNAFLLGFEDGSDFVVSLVLFSEPRPRMRGPRLQDMTLPGFAHEFAENGGVVICVDLPDALARIAGPSCQSMLAAHARYVSDSRPTP